MDVFPVPVWLIRQTTRGETGHRLADFYPVGRQFASAKGTDQVWKMDAPFCVGSVHFLTF